MINTSQSITNDTACSSIHSDLYTIGQDGILKILLLEDNENDAELISRHLGSSALKIESTLVSNKEDYIQTLENQEFDAILSDHNLPGFSSLEALRIRNKIKFHIPFIVISGSIPEEYAVTILQEGANDYILKDRPQRLVSAITEAIKKQKTISDKILAEQELVRIYERLRLVGKATADATWDWNLSTNEIIWGEGFEILFGHRLRDISSRIDSWKEHIHPDDKTSVINGLNRIITSKQANWIDEYRYKRADGSYAIVVDKGIVLRDENGKAYRMVGAMQDITHVRKLEREIIEQKFNHQKQNTEIAIQAQEEERKNIGKELHDNINQLMASAKMMINTSRNSPELHDICIDKSYEAINLAIEEVRKLTHYMVPPSFISHAIFVDAVSKMVFDINFCNKIDITIDISPDERFEICDEKIRLTFYRIIQEQVNNILKYAKAGKASINLKIVKNAYVLIISDNGMGMDPGKKSKGIGLRNITSRAELYSGNMKIITAPGKGFTLKIEIPL